MGKTAILFPGQGAQSVGMGRDVVEHSAAARQTLDEAGRILGFDLADICFQGPVEKLNSTEMSQPAIFVISAAIWRAIQENPAAAANCRPEAAAGLSLGEYTALHMAGSLSFEEGVKLVHQRGCYMQAAADARRGGMVSVMGLDEAKLNEAIAEARGGDVLAAANFNSPGQVVLSGDIAACERAAVVVEKLGGRAIPLKVAGAFHSPLMAPAAEKLGERLATTRLNPPGMPVVSNVTADYHGGPSETARLLRTQVAEPIRWSASIERLIADGFDRFVEVGPGRVLTGLMRGINRTVKAVNVSDWAGIGKLAAT